MPNLTFRITEITKIFNTTINDEGWSLQATGRCENNSGFTGEFTIHEAGKSWNGFGALALITLKPRQSRAEAKGTPTDSPYDSDDKTRDVIRVDCFGDGPLFQIRIALPADTIASISQLDLTREAVGLMVDNGIGLCRQGEQVTTSALTFGPDPDGREIVWHADKQAHQWLEDIVFYITSKDRQKHENWSDDDDDKVVEPLDRASLEETVQSVLSATTHIAESIQILRSTIIKISWAMAAALLLFAVIR